MKKILSIMLCVLMVMPIALFSITASAGEAITDENGYTTASYTINDESEKESTYTVSAKGNDIKIVITSPYIDGNTIHCNGTSSEYEDELWGKADGLDIFRVEFSDYDTSAGRDYSKNSLVLYVRSSCGEGSDGHDETVDSVFYNLSYYFYEEDKTTYLATIGNYYDKDGNYHTGTFYGSKSEATSLDIKTEGNTMTVEFTLPDEVVDYNNESNRTLEFDSENLIVSGDIQSAYYQMGESNSNLAQKIWNKVKEVFRKFFALLKKFFTFDF